MKYLLDTNVCVVHLRGKNTVALQHFSRHQAVEIVLCSVVVGELRFGAEKSVNPAKEHAQVDAFVSRFVSLPFDDPSARLFGEIRHRLESSGKAIGPYDTMIAAIALAHRLTLVTHNTAEFSRVPGLTLEDWEIP